MSKKTSMRSRMNSLQVGESTSFLLSEFKYESIASTASKLKLRIGKVFSYRTNPPSSSQRMVTVTRVR